MLFQPSNIYPSTFSGIGAGTVDVTQGLNVSWQVNGDTPMTAYQIKIYQNDSGSTLMYDSGSVAVSPAFEPHDKYGNATYFTAIISAAALSSAGIVNGYQYGYKMLITQWWGVSDYVEQTSASVFITRSTPTLAIDTITTPVASSSLTITATYSQAQGDPISTVEWVFALAGSESTPIRKTGAISTQVLSFDVDGLITGNTYSVMCNVVTSNGMEASTGFVQFPVSYSSSSLGINYQLAQLKNSSAVYLSWDDLGSNILSYPYTDTTKTTNGITFTVNGEGDIVATGTASSDAYFTIAEGTTSQLGITAGQKMIVTSDYSGAKIVVTETNGSNVVVATIEGNDPMQYIATSTTNTLKFSIVIPSGTALGAGQQLQPMIVIEDKIVALNDVSVTMQPIQNLHGYANPWPGGGGKNKFLTTLETGTKNQVTATVDSDGFIHLSGTASATTIFSLGGFTFSAGEYYITMCPPGGSTSTYRVYASFGANDIGNGLTKTFTQETAITFQINISSGTNVDGLVFKPMICLSSEGTEFAPYANICPISGLTGLSVYRTGKNLVDPSKKVATSTTTAKWYNDGTGFLLHGGQAYALSSNISTDATYFVYFYDMGGTQLTYGKWTATYTPSADVYVYFQYYETGGAHLADAELQLELGSATTYEQFNGNAYAVDWTTQAGTVYGGTLDVDTGVLTVDKAGVDLGSVSWTKYGSTANYDRYITSGIDSLTKNSSSVVCSIFKPRIGSETIVANMIWIASGNSKLSATTDVGAYANASDFKSGMSGQMLVYELATPLTYQLTPQEIAVLVGTNNVWSNAANVTVTYTKDSGTQATLNGSIVTFNDSNAQIIPTPQFVPGITGISIYRYLQGESALQHIYDLDTGATSILDYYAPSQMKVSYLIVAHSSSGDLFLQTTQFTPTFWFYSILLCDTDSNGDYHVSKEYIFKYGVETGAVSNNNTPTIQRNFTPYPNRQPISSLYKTGKLTGYIGKVNSMNRYSDSVSLQNAIYDISLSVLTKFLKTRKGDVIMVDTASPIQMKTDDNTVEQSLAATVDWIEMGDADGVSIVSVPTDTFWPI